MRLLLKIEDGDGYETLLPFIYESKEKAIEDLRAAYNTTEDARQEFRRMYDKVRAPLEALYIQRRQYAIGTEPQELIDAIAAEMRVTDLRNFNKPSDKVDFASLDLTLDSFVYNHEGNRSVYMPEIITVDEFFAGVE